MDLGIAMIPGTSLVLAALEKSALLKVERTRQIDLLVPRTRARIRYGSLPPRKTGRRNWLGISPILESRVQSIRENMISMSRSLFDTQIPEPPKPDSTPRANDAPKSPPES